MLSIQNDAEWIRFCAEVIGRPDMVRHPLYASNPDRVRNRAELNRIIREALATLTRAEFIARLRKADIAHGIIRSLEEFTRHPALITAEVDTPTGPVVLPRRSSPRTSLFGRKSVPAFGQHSEVIRREFSS